MVITEASPEGAERLLLGRDHQPRRVAADRSRTVVELSLVWDTVTVGSPQLAAKRRRPVTVTAPWMVDIELPRALKDVGALLRTVAPGTPLSDRDIEELVEDADAIVLAPQPISMPSREGSAHDVARMVASLVARAVPAAHVVVASTFLAGHGVRHGSNRTVGLRGQREFEYAVRASCERWTIVRPTWLSDDPPGCHAIRLTQDPLADGMLAPGDFGTTIAATIGDARAWGRTFTAYNEPAGQQAGLTRCALDGLLIDFEATSR